MFSARFKWDLATNELSHLLAEKKKNGVEIIDLTLSNPTQAGLDFPRAEILAALGQAQAMHYDPDPRGLRSARQAIADYYLERQQNISPEQIFLTASTSEAYSWLFKLLTDQGDEILVPQPSYPLFEFLATLEGVKLVPYELHYAHPLGWRIDFDSLTAALTAQTKAIIIVNPNNPTGSYLKQKEYEYLEKICVEKQLALLVDEVFTDYAVIDDATRVTDFSQAQALTFVLNGFSKMLALPQMKLGWIVLHGAANLQHEATVKLELIADTFLSVNTPVQLAASQWLRLRRQMQTPIVARVQTNLRYVQAALVNSSLRLLQMEGGWSAVLEIPRQTSEEELILQLLTAENILVHPGYFFDFPREAYLILSLLTPPAKFQPAVQAILQRLR